MIRQSELDEQELISVIIPVYQTEKYLVRCLDSVIAQTYGNLEIIVVDDGSKDNSGKICDEYAQTDSRVRVIHKENGGQSSARNAGLEAAHGKYIGFLDSDDCITTDMYMYLHNLISKNDADIAMCSYTRRKEKLRHRQPEKINIYSENQQIMKFFFRIDGGESFYSVWNRLYKKDILQNIRFYEGTVTEDVMFTYEVYKIASKIIVSNQKKYFYFKNTNGITRSKLCKKDFDLFKIWDLIVREEKDGMYYSWAELNRKRATFTLYTKALIYGSDKEIENEILEGWKQELIKNYKCLSSGKLLDRKRKVILFIICKFNFYNFLKMFGYFRNPRE